ncbi:MAG: thioredoxin-disulfide reductase [Candidatus Omnitrophota bacterium]
MYDLIIVGAGPAGLTAALYAGRSRLKTLVLEKMVPGGRILLTETIENFPGFSGGITTYDLISRMKQQVDSLEVKIELEQVLEVDTKLKKVVTSAGAYSAHAIIIATGARAKKLDVPGEDRLTGRGVSYCATCDAPLYKEKNVVVVGGGNTVAEEAFYLARFAKSVTIIHRRDELRASAILQEKLRENKKIKFILSHTVSEINGQDKLESIKVKDVNTSKENIVACDGVFIYIGYDPDTNFLKNKIKLNGTGFIITDDIMATSHEGIFACGDCREKSLYQVITACADGAVAADSAYKYIVGKCK